MRGSDPKLSQFGPAIGWLLAKGVSSSRLGTLFQTTAENVRVIAHRARQPETEEYEEEPDLSEPPSPELVAAAGVRGVPDEVVHTPAGDRKLDWLRNEIDITAAQHARQYTFLDAIRALKKLASHVGYAADARRIALLAQLRQHSAWFLVHSSQCVSAAREARAARNLSRIAYHESPCREYADRFIQSGLIVSHSCLLARRPREALRTLDLVRSAAESIRAPLGSDHFRQRGVALLQLREDDLAAEQFRESAEAMERLGEATVPAQLIMTGVRHCNLLGHANWEKAYELFAIARQSFGSDSLEAAMALHWAVASGLSTDSPASVQQAVELIAAQPAAAPHFGHQLTIRKLLSLTPELGLDARLQRAWARRALYENAFRNR